MNEWKYPIFTNIGRLDKVYLSFVKPSFVNLSFNVNMSFTIIGANHCTAVKLAFTEGHQVETNILINQDGCC